MATICTSRSKNGVKYRGGIQCFCNCIECKITDINLNIEARESDDTDS